MKIYEIINTTCYGDHHCAFVSSKKKAIDYIKAQGEITAIRISKDDNPFRYKWYHKKYLSEKIWNNIVNSLKGVYEIFSIHESFYVITHTVE